MALEHLFQGSALNAVDAKGRVSIPAFLRGVIERRGDARTIVLAKHEAFACLSAYDPAYAALKHAKLERLLEKEETSPDAQLEYQQRNLMAFAATEEVPYDSSGRIVVPADDAPQGRRSATSRCSSAPARHSRSGTRSCCSRTRAFPTTSRTSPASGSKSGSRLMTSTGPNMAPHVPVLVNEVIAALAIHGGETVVDGTFGAGGYTRAMLGAGAGRVIGFDRDPDAIEAGTVARPGLRASPSSNERFSQMDRALAERGIGQVDAIALDIGVSSMQLDRAERGFSFQADGPLDMRMSKSGLTAAEFLNSAEEAEIARVLRDYGEEPRARAIARAIVAARPVERTAELAAIVRRAAGFRPGQKSDPATRTFQAIRIHLNAELDELEAGPRGRRARAAPRRPARRRHLSQPRGPDREALLPRTQRRNAGRFAPPSRACRSERADLRAGRQAGFPDGARAGREPARPLGAAEERGPDLGPSHGRKRLQ